RVWAPRAESAWGRLIPALSGGSRRGDLTQRVDACAVGAHAIAVAIDLQDSAPVEEAIEHGGGDHGVVEELPPAGDAAVGGQADAALEVALGNDLEERGGALAGQG